MLTNLPTAVGPNWGTLFGGVGDGVTAAIAAAVPLGIPVLLSLAGLSIVIGVFRKFGVKR